MARGSTSKSIVTHPSFSYIQYVALYVWMHLLRLACYVKEIVRGQYFSTFCSPGWTISFQCSDSFLLACSCLAILLRHPINWLLLRYNLRTDNGRDDDARPGKKMIFGNIIIIIYCIERTVLSINIHFLLSFLLLLLRHCQITIEWIRRKRRRSCWWWHK